MMKTSKVIEERITKSLDEKNKLLKNIERNDKLKLIPLMSNKNPLVLINNNLSSSCKRTCYKR